MKKLIFLLALQALAQTGKVTTGNKSWTFNLPPGANVTDLTCDKTSLLVGESSTCVVTINPVAPTGGTQITPFTADPQLSLNPSTNLIVPAGSFTVQFVVTRTY